MNNYWLNCQNKVNDLTQSTLLTYDYFVYGCFYLFNVEKFRCDLDTSNLFRRFIQNFKNTSQSVQSYHDITQ